MGSVGPRRRPVWGSVWNLQTRSQEGLGCMGGEWHLLTSLMGRGRRLNRKVSWEVGKAVPARETPPPPSQCPECPLCPLPGPAASNTGRPLGLCGQGPRTHASSNVRAAVQGGGRGALFLPAPLQTQLRPVPAMRLGASPPMCQVRLQHKPPPPRSCKAYVLRAGLTPCPVPARLRQTPVPSLPFFTGPPPQQNPLQEAEVSWPGTCWSSAVTPLIREPPLTHLSSQRVLSPLGTCGCPPRHVQHPCSALDNPYKDTRFYTYPSRFLVSVCSCLEGTGHVMHTGSSRAHTTVGMGKSGQGRAGWQLRQVPMLQT